MAPEVQAPQIALIKLYTRYGYNELAQALINHLRNETSLTSGKNDLDQELSLLEANTWLGQTNAANARSVLQSMLKKYPNDAHIADVVLHTYVSFGDYTNALELVKHQLALAPDNLTSLFNQASIYMNLDQCSNALPVLDRALTLSNLPPIRLARALARVEAGQYDAAEADYEELRKTATNNLPIYSGLAEIAARRHDTNRAIEYLERCLNELPVGNPQRELVVARLNALNK